MWYNKLREIGILLVVKFSNMIFEIYTPEMLNSLV